MLLAFLFLSFLGGEVFMSFEYAIPKSGFISLTQSVQFVLYKGYKIFPVDLYCYYGQELQFDIL